MKTIEELLYELNNLNVKLWVDGEQLRYKAPKGALPPAKRAELVERKAEMIAFIKKTQNRDILSSPIVPISREGDLPLSYAQQRLWFLDQLEGANAIYNMPAAVRLEGPLNRAALEKSLREMVQRHETLRTTFPTTNGKPVQVIDPLPITHDPLPLINLQPLSPEEQTIEIQRLAHEEAQCPFELSLGPLLRTTLLQLKSELHVLLVNMHHIISDGWSIGIFIRELATLYEAFSTGESSPLPALPIQYADFAHWQRQWLSGEVLQTQLNYWQQQLTDMPALLALPTDHHRPPIQTFHGRTQAVEISEELSRQLNELSQQANATLFMTLLAAFATLLGRYSGTEDIVVGSPIANRNLSQTESLIGFFVNTLVLRTSLSGNPRFIDLLTQVRQVCLEAYDHQDVPFEQLVEIIQPQRNLSHSALFQVMFALQNAPIANLELSNLNLRPLELENITAKFDLTLSMAETTHGITATLEYNTDLFKAGTITRMIGHFQTLLKGIVANPAQPIAQLPLLADYEKHQLLIEWNNTTTTAYPQDQCIHQLFDSQVERTPEAIAVVFENQQLSYHELNLKANQLAHYLQSVSVKPEVLVGICVERSLEMVIGLLGILKAGGAYLPLDPAYPAERLAFMLEDAQVSVLLTQSRLTERLPKTTALVVCLDAETVTFSRFRSDNPVCEVNPANLAYMIYTSGSTGKPKGVMIQHQSLVNHSQAIIGQYQLTSSDNILQFAAINFDVAAEEIFPTLLSGAQLVLRSLEIFASFANFHQFIDNNQLTVLNLPAPYWHDWVSNFSQITTPLPERLRLVVVGSDKVLSERFFTWQQQVGPHIKWLNAYGPTETTITATIYEPSVELFDEEISSSSLPIGRPITNTQTYLLDNFLQPVPIGVPGELYLGGTGLARGYLCSPCLTADKFIPNPFNEGSNTRLYQTGDLARYLPNGNLEYLGRIDNQVKIRGFRIELGEIEAVLSQHPAVRENVVIVQEPKEGDKRLVAYWVVQSEQLIDNTTLRAFVTEKLPNYMVPSALVPIDAIPLTPNGKIDRRALERLSVNSWKDSGETLVAPRTPEEELLAGIWASVLGVKRIGIFDNFFELGGHSLLATQVMSRIRDTLSIELPLRRLFEYPTIAGLCEHLSQARRGESLPPITAINRDEPLRLSFAQQRLWFLAQLEGENATYNMPAAVRLEGLLHLAALEQSLTKIVQRHETLRTTFPTAKGKPVPVIAPLPMTPDSLPIANLQALSPNNQTAEVLRLVNEEAQRPFDLSLGPLFRTTLLQLEGESHVLLLNMHHIISDGWSIGILIREFATLYEAFSTGQSSPLPPLPIQYGDFAHWQQQWLSGETLDKQVNYWQKQLAEAPALLELPTDYPRPPIQRFRGATEPTQLTPALTEQLKTLSQQTGTTVFMTLLSAFAILLSRYSGRSDIVIGSPIANRTLSQTESLIGFFVNTLVLRVDLSGNPQVDELLKRVKRVALDAYAHQDIPFERLVETLQPERNLSYTPLFQVMLVLQNAPIANLKLSNLNLSPLELENLTAKFDLTLSMEETAYGITATLEYNTDLFNAGTITRMIGHFQTLLQGIVANPAQPIAQLPLLTESEKHQLLIEWNNTATAYPQDQCLHQWFEAQVERTPEAIAVVFENQQLSYHELNIQANCVAHYLQTLGVKPEVLVGICVERSCEMVIGLLGILKAGGAYLPLDPTYPTERLAFMLADASVSVLVTQSTLIEGLPETTAKVVCLDTEASVFSRRRDDNPRSGVQPKNLAYVIYTSGSTGKPKGVLVPHSNVTRLFAATQSWFHFNERDVWTLFHSYAFDFSVWELWGALLYGGRLVVVPYWVSRSPDTFYELLSAQGVTVLNQTPSAFRQLIQAEERVEIKKDLDLRLVIFGGEALEFQSLKPWFERHGENRPQLINMYGITETTVHVTYRPLIRADIKGASSVIGVPIPDLQVYILDSYLQPQPIGVPGELYIGGAGLARGYLNRSDLTKERFIPNPFGEEPSSRLYKTGDLARYLPDGQIDYLGRIDNQVKIRGFRIELGEIEAILMQHAAVQETVITVQEDSNNHKYLVAYLVPESSSALATNELRQFLKEKLPDYMVPATFVSLEQLPLTSHGKVDYRALKSPESARPASAAIFATPRTLEEEVLAGIWSDVLHLEQVGIYDNFFDLGGDSILSIEVLAKAKQAGFELSLLQLFQSQTLYELARSIRQGEDRFSSRPKTEAFSLVSTEDRLKLPDDIEDAYPLAVLQAGLLFHSEYSPETAVYHDVFSYHLKVPFVHSTLHQAIQPLISRHPILRTGFAFTGFKEPLQLVHKIIEVPLPIADLCHLSNVEQEVVLTTWIEAEKKRHFDWSQPPLLRFQIHRRTTDTFNITLSFHHAIFDGWSVALLMTELFQHYLSQLGRDIAIQPPPIITFRDFIALERLTLESEVARQYWLETLNDFTTLELPRWPISYRTVQVGQTGVLEVPISVDISNGLKQLARTASVPIKSVLLAAHIKVLTVLGNQTDILTGLVGNGRLEETDGERVLGLFLNTLPFRLNLQGGTWIDLVQETFKMERAALPYRRFPLAEMQRMLGEQVLFETAFNFTHFHVYQDILGIKEVEVFRGQSFERTNFTLLTHFSLDLVFKQVTLTLHYDAGELCEEQALAIGDYYTEALAAMAREPYERYERHSLLSLPEREKLLIDWNETVVMFPQQCIHQLFEAQVEQTPEAIAVVFESSQLTYRELNNKANQLAHHLHILGVKPEVMIGICVERSLEMVIGLLGILKAGGAYVPLDPNYPLARLAFMLEDSQVRVLLTQTNLVVRLPSHKEVQVVCLDTFLTEPLSEANPISGVVPSNLAYVIYTSGSTGQPKGVAIEHDSTMVLLNWAKEVFTPKQLSGVLASTSVCFDLSVFEIFVPLSWGGSIILVEDALHLPTLSKCLNITLVNTVPSAIAELIRTEGIPASVQVINLAGEALKKHLVQQLYQQETVQHIFNLYGPSEDTTYSTFALMKKGSTESPTIGRPIANTQIYILDKHEQPTPIGVPGELHIGGAGLARGYLNRPDLTQKKFINNPFSDEPESRLYKTGDLARYLPDGQIDYLGRIDNQVKVRGFRIELSEIEAVLSQHPAVRETVVTCTEVQPNDQRLIAYLVSELNAERIRLDDAIQDSTMEQLSQWEHVWDENYSQSTAVQEPTFNIAGWRSSYTGLALSEEEMREWVNATVKTIRSWQPQRVLEIGCGTGLLLFRIAPYCTQYWGTDLSPVVLQQVEQLKRTVDNLDQVALFNRAADDFNGIEPETFDTVILNSVIQYFPDINYLLKVLEKATQVVKPGGSIFIGDVRSLPLLKAYHASVQFNQAPASLSRLELQQRVQQRIAQEEELVIDPTFFLAFKQHTPLITQVKIQPKRGQFQNELTRFRYDVILQVKGSVRSPEVEIPWFNWPSHPFTLSTLRQQLQQNQPDLFGWQAVANARLETEANILAWLANADQTETVGQLQNALSTRQPAGIDPEQLLKLSDEFPYDIEISWTDTNTDGRYDVLFNSSASNVPFPMPNTPLTRPWHHYANNPLQSKLNRQLVPQLRQFMQDQLPAYMVPSAFIMLEAIPLTPNGKVDRQALPNPDTSNRALEKNYVVPKTPTEEILTTIWADVLGVSKIGIFDNFFELGGHSLLATQLISRVRDTFSIELPLRQLFESPTVASLAIQIETTRFDRASMPPIQEVIERTDNLSLSFAQQRLWFLDQLEAGSASYHMSAAVRLLGTLHFTALEQSLIEIVQRHETLRTTFPIRNGMPVQVINPLADTRYQLSVIDLTELPSPEPTTEEVQRLATVEAHCAFNLAQGPLFRSTLWKLGLQEQVLGITMHHIISDGWSIGIFIRELATLYKAFCKGETSPLPPLPIQYADFADWQRQWLSGEVRQTQLNYWLQQLAGIPALLKLPTDHPRPPIQTFRGASEPFELNEERLSQLKQLSQTSQTTLFMILLAAFVTLLGRYSAQHDIVVGSPIANRNRVEIEPLIGFFVNTLVLRTNLSGNPSFIDLLAQVRHVCLDAYAYQDVPFEQLVELLQPERHLSHSAVFQVMFVLQNTPMANLELPGLSLNLLEIERITAKFDLTLSMAETPQGLIGHLEYNADLFNADTIARMARHFQLLLNGIVTNPAQPLSELPRLTDPEKHQILVEWNQTATDFPEQQCIHQLFEAQVQRTPEAIAVVFENQQLTYHELNLKANQLADYLQSLGVKPEVLVGICVERSVEMVIGLMGIIKAGGAYLPLDPTYPAERLAFMLADAEVSVLLTQSTLTEGLPETTAEVVCLDTEASVFSRLSTDNPRSGVVPVNLAYVIYTSGSTGRPKGVMVSHQALCNHTHWMQNTFPLSEKDKVLQKTPVSFDASVWEFYAPLVVGAQLVIAKPDGHKDSRYLLKVIAQNQVTILQLVPALLQVFLKEKEIETIKSLKRIFCGGDVLPVALIEDFFAKLNIDLINIYGPTEACIDTAFFPCLTNHQHRVPIGRPIANTQIYILDRYQQPVPIGVPGELHIGGVGVARGYLNRPDSSAQQFVPNPFSEVPGSRLYKTGDLACYLPNGSLEYLGRIDNQIKIRGFRIELGEIETVLVQHPSVRETVVIAQENSPGNKRLIAYVVPQPPNVPTNSQLQAFLKDKLPDYMIPALWVMLDALPLTPNGKLDRRALPAPEKCRSPLEEATYVKPQTEMEQLIAELWQQILQKDKVSIYDNFFDLGGHSLLMVQVQNQLQQKLGQPLSMVELFQYPSVSALSSYLSQKPSQASDSQSNPEQTKRRVGQTTIVQERQRRQKHRTKRE